MRVCVEGGKEVVEGALYSGVISLCPDSFELSCADGEGSVNNV